MFNYLVVCNFFQAEKIVQKPVKLDACIVEPYIAKWVKVVTLMYAHGPTPYVAHGREMHVFPYTNMGKLG